MELECILELSKLCEVKANYQSLVGSKSETDQIQKGFDTHKHKYIFLLSNSLPDFSRRIQLSYHIPALLVLYSHLNYLLHLYRGGWLLIIGTFGHHGRRQGIFLPAW